MIVQVVRGIGYSAVLLGVAFVVFYPTFRSARPPRPRSPESICLSNINQMSIGSLMYAQDYDERLPIASTWMDTTMSHRQSGGGNDVKKAFHCPSVGESDYGYAFDIRLSGKSISSIPHPDTTVIIYDSNNLSRNATDAMTSLPNPPRHGEGKVNSVGYVDGHAKAVGAAGLSHP